MVHVVKLMLCFEKCVIGKKLANRRKGSKTIQTQAVNSSFVNALGALQRNFSKNPS